MMDGINGISSRLFAQLNCNKGASGCSWYHGNWHLLRALGIVSTSAIHEASIARLLKVTLVGVTTPKILLTGSSDETLLRLAHNTCLAHGVKEILHAVDICVTPLAFMEVYARENDIKLVTFHSDILDFAPKEKFDIILTHAFMGYFDAAQRPLLMKKWQQLLSEQGKIVTIQRVRPVGSPALVTFTEQQAANFLAVAVAAAKNPRLLSAPDLNLVKTAANEFTKKFIAHAITSKSELEALFFEAGLVFHSLEYQRLAKMGRLSGPSVPSNGEYAHIVAGKS